ncbi:MAG: HlyD family efflux transporter periplasmic adaptor subunit [Candidatus Kerfeldbacteria bacterium]
MADIPKPKKKPIYKRWWFWFLIVLAIVLIIGSTIGVGAYRQALLDSYSYLEESVDVQNRTIKKTISTNGTIVPDEVTALYPAGAGTVNEVNVEVGDDVTEGDVLATIDVSAGGPTFTQELEAPYDGRVIAMNSFPNDVVSPAEQLVLVAYRSSHIQFLASDSEILNLSVGQEVMITVPTYENGKEVYTGEVEFVDVKKFVPSPAEAAQTTDVGYLVKVSSGDLPEQLTKTLGLSVDLEIVVEERSDTVSVVTGAIQYDTDDQTYVFLVPIIDADFVSRAAGVEDVTVILEKRYIETGFQGDEYIEIIDGLRAGDEVMLYVPTTARSIF